MSQHTPRSMRIVIDYDETDQDTEELASLVERALAPLVESGKVTVRELVDVPSAPATS